MALAASPSSAFPSSALSPEGDGAPAARAGRPPDFAGLWVPLITPFSSDGEVDHAALDGLVRRLSNTGIAGFVVCGSTAEAAALDADEQLAVLATVREAAPPLRRIMGVSGANLAALQGWIRRLASESIAGLLVPAPSYIRPSQAGLQAWFTAIADAAAVPVLIYDIPERTGSTLARETLLHLAGHPNIHGVKDCGGEGAKTRALIADGRLQVLAGEDAELFATLAEGGAGAIAASAHLCTDRFVAVAALLRDGQLVEARRLWQALVPLVELLFAETNPAPLKALLSAHGLVGDRLRAPMMPASESLRARLLALEAALSPP